MGPAVTVQWVAEPDGREPSESARRSLAEWAEARGVTLAEPREAPLSGIALDLAVADTVEDELEHARDAIAALDATSADRALAKSEALLHAHPELPQAAWLLAEVLRAESVRWRRLPPHDAAKSASAWQRAASLDGGRAPGVGEGMGDTATSNRASAVTARLAFDPVGAAATDDTVASLDGVPVQGGMLVGAEGDHQLTVTKGGRLFWAAWFTMKGGAVFHVTLPEPAPCTRDDVGRVRVALGTDAVVARGVLCSDWVFAEETPGGAGELQVATCEGAQCGAPYHWRVGTMGPVLPPSRASHGHWPAWATWTLVGASALAITGVTLAATGTFRPTHDEPVFTTGGLHVASAPTVIRFGE